MSKTLHIVVTCTKKKTQQAAAACMVRSLPKGSISERATEWIRRLNDDDAKPIIASDLYAGDHWQVARSLIDVGAKVGQSVRLWVCSAGYGLVSSSAKLKPYSATFSRTHADSVCRGVVDDDGPAPAWWRRLADWAGPERGAPRSISEVAAEFNRSTVWVVASAVYARALANDLAAAKRQLRQPENLVIFSAGTASLPELNKHLLPCDARLQAVVGGARRSLNIRLARYALIGLGKSGPDLDSLHARFARILQRQPDVPRYERTPMSDAEVKAFIRSALRANGKMKHSVLLRDLRDGGNACEQKRFAALFRSVWGERNET